MPEGLSGERVDAAVARMLGLSRSRVVELIGAGQVLLDGAAITKSDRVSVGSMLEVELDDHEGKHQNPGDRKHISKTLTLAEGSARVANKPQREQSTEQADGGKRLELSYRDDLGDKISC